MLINVIKIKRITRIVKHDRIFVPHREITVKFKIIRIQMHIGKKFYKSKFSFIKLYFSMIIHKRNSLMDNQ